MLTIGRAESLYVVPRRHAAAESLRRRADDVLRERVPEMLPALVAAAFPDSAVCLVERIGVDFAFAAGAFDDEELARRWSREIVRALDAALRKGEDVLHFPTRAAFVASYVADRAAGRADGRWYYRAFDSLSALPAASALRVAIVREEPDVALAILRELARLGRLNRVIETLSDAGALEVWEAAFAEPRTSCEPSSELITQLLASWETALPRGIRDDRAGLARAALRLAAAVLGGVAGLRGYEVVGPDDVAPTVLRGHIEAMLRFAAMLHDVDDPWALVEAIVEGDAAAAVLRSATRERITDLSTLRFFTKLAATRADLVTCAASTLRSSQQPATTHPDAELAGSRFPALALLLPPLVDLEILAGDEDAPLRALLLAACAGDNRLREVVSDPILRLFCGERDIALEDLTAVDAERDLNITEAAESVLRAFAARLPGFANSSPAHLRANFLEGDGAIRFAPAPLPPALCALPPYQTIDVYLPSLPLALVLRIAGVDSKQFTVPWLPGQVITLHLPEER